MQDLKVDASMGAQVSVLRNKRNKNDDNGNKRRTLDVYFKQVYSIPIVFFIAAI